MEEVRIPIRVKPGSSRTRVGGRYGQTSLIVSVSAKAIDGAATEAALRAVAEALGMPRRAVLLTTGASSRDKVLGVSSEDPDTVRELVRDLLG
ncbi:DUF167 domain-containing protein [Catenulispora sp. NF23]|uniref:DUF167 domain-containing protein n=1 Tax=Catenulispora pinistramenti TaxID=2705254 RepID=UPI001BAB30AE|nr:DUF167 domain-containing protein [Catenulispora pinistramenti]MBS2537761.1 DUF167 domain-containing protein [Catenulispora pinistramenti]